MKMSPTSRPRLRDWQVDGLLFLRSDPHAEGFYAEVKSEVIAREIALLALQAVAGNLPLRGTPVIRPRRIKPRGWAILS